MVEPFAVVVHACRRVKVAVGQNVLVCGAGPVGIMAMLCAKAFGADKVCITDIDPSKLDLAKRMGADNTFLVNPKNFNDQEFEKNLQKDFGCSPDTTIECTGVESSNAFINYELFLKIILKAFRCLYMRLKLGVRYVSSV